MIPNHNQMVLVKLRDFRDGVFYHLGKFINGVWYIYPDCQGKSARKLRYEETILTWYHLRENGQDN